MLFSQASQGHMLNMNRLNVIVDSTDNMVFTVNIDQGSTLSQALFPLRDVVDGINNDREQAHGQKVQLIVANSHLHGDHYAAWNQFVDRPNTLSVVLTHNEVMDYWSFNSYPEQRINYKLGGRQFILTSATVFVSEVAAGATAARHRSARRCFTHRVVG